MSSSLSRNERRFCDEQSARDTASLAVVVDGKLVVDVILLCSEASERRKHHAVLESHVADLDRGEELGCGHYGWGDDIELRVLKAFEELFCLWSVLPA